MMVSGSGTTTHSPGRKALGFSRIEAVRHTASPLDRGRHRTIFVHAIPIHSRDVSQILSCYLLACAETDCSMYRSLFAKIPVSPLQTLGHQASDQAHPQPTRGSDALLRG